MEIGRPFNFVGRGELLQERRKRFRRAADDGAAVANQHRALQQLRMRCDGFEQRVVGGIGQIELRVFVFVFADQAAQRCVELRGELLKVSQRGRRGQVFDDLELFAVLCCEGLCLFEGGAGFRAAGVVVDLPGLWFWLDGTCSNLKGWRVVAGFVVDCEGVRDF